MRKGKQILFIQQTTNNWAISCFVALLHRPPWNQCQLLYELCMRYAQHHQWRTSNMTFLIIQYSLSTLLKLYNAGHLLHLLCIYPWTSSAS